jgi:hypothetical protein
LAASCRSGFTGYQESREGQYVRIFLIPPGQIDNGVGVPPRLCQQSDEPIFGAWQGADSLRTHDVAATRDAVTLLAAIAGEASRLPTSGSSTPPTHENGS